MQKLNRLVECLNHPNGESFVSRAAAQRHIDAKRAEMDERGVLVYRTVDRTRMNLELQRQIDAESGLRQWKGRKSGGGPTVLQLPIPKFEFGGNETWDGLVERVDAICRN